MERGSVKEPQSKHKCCMGMLYYSQARYDKGRPPVCGGLNRRLKEAEPGVQLPTESVPGGEFKYICMGYSAYDEEGLRQSAAKRNSRDEPVPLPYCEGLEIVSAAAVSRKSEQLLTGGPALPPATSSSGGSEADGVGPQQRPGRHYVPGLGRDRAVPEDMNWEKFKQRFERISWKIVDKMGQNLAFMAATTKKSWEQIIREITGGGGSGRER